MPISECSKDSCHNPIPPSLNASNASKRAQEEPYLRFKNSTVSPDQSAVCIWITSV